MVINEYDDDDDDDDDNDDNFDDDFDFHLWIFPIFSIFLKKCLKFISYYNHNIVIIVLLKYCPVNCLRQLLITSLFSFSLK